MSLSSLNAKLAAANQPLVMAAPEKRRRIDSKKTPARLAAIAEAVKLGMPISRAAALAKVHHSTVSTWIKEDADFADAIATAEAEFIEGNMKIIRTAAAAPGGWTAAAWSLERRFPREFSQPQVQIAMNTVNIEVSTLDHALAALKSSPAAKALEEMIGIRIPGAESDAKPAPPTIEI